MLLWTPLSAKWSNGLNVHIILKTQFMNYYCFK